jgi:hypothetical protein
VAPEGTRSRSAAGTFASAARTAGIRIPASATTSTANGTHTNGHQPPATLGGTATSDAATRPVAGSLRTVATSTSTAASSSPPTVHTTWNHGAGRLPSPLDSTGRCRSASTPTSE